MTPKLIHIIYFPWDNQHRLKSDENDFDHTPIELLRNYAPDFEVRLWTYSKARAFCLAHFPDIWATVTQCPHPTMMVDILRWLFVHHFGGIYWQITATPLVPMASLLPARDKNVRLFTEFNMTPEQCQAMASEPIRRGEPEEPTRVLNQVFAAEAGAPFIRNVLDLVLERNRTLVPKNDYDILYIGANAALSTAYDRYGKGDPSVELIDRATAKTMIHWKYLGSWRKEKKAQTKATEPAPSPRLDRIPSAAALLYRWRKHAHTRMIEEEDAKVTRLSVIPAILSKLGELNVKSVYEAPAGSLGAHTLSVRYTGAHPSRTAIRQLNRQSSEIRYRHVNLLYTRLPKVDLFACPDFLEWLPYAEIRRVLHRIASAQPRYLALTAYRFLGDMWDTALGDFRPLDFQQPPFNLPRPDIIIALAPRAYGRTDRSLMIWETSRLALRKQKCLDSGF